MRLLELMLAVKVEIWLNFDWHETRILGISRRPTSTAAASGTVSVTISTATRALWSLAHDKCRIVKIQHRLLLLLLLRVWGLVAKLLLDHHHLAANCRILRRDWTRNRRLRHSWIPGGSNRAVGGGGRCWSRVQFAGSKEVLVMCGDDWGRHGALKTLLLRVVVQSSGD